MRLRKEADTKSALEEKAKEFEALQNGAEGAAHRGYVDNVIEDFCTQAFDLCFTESFTLTFSFTPLIVILK